MPSTSTIDCKGKIVVGGSSISLRRAPEGDGASGRGIVVGGFDYQDLRKLLGYDLGVAITGGENLATTLVLTEGFGAIAMAERTFELLKCTRAHGHRSTAPRRSARASSGRRSSCRCPSMALPSGEVASSTAGLDTGSTIRVIREPHFGRLGEVTGLPNELQKMESESMVRVLSVKFSDGTEATLPRANVEMIEG